MNQAQEPMFVKEIDKLYTIFKETICKLDLKEDNSEWDMNSFYSPNHACIWNKISNIGKKCRIHSKNSFIAVVEFENVETTLPGCIYRLEDLEKTT